MDVDLLALGLLWYVVFLFSTTCHEAAHAFAAKLGGDLTAFEVGQVTLNPWPHIRREPFGMVLIPLLSFVLSRGMIGWASAPYDPVWQRRYPRRAAWMSLAGPAANFGLVVLAAVLIHAGIWYGIFQAPRVANFTHVVESSGTEWADGAAQLLSIVFSLNLMLGAFNLLPVMPLDGFSALPLLLPERAGRTLLEWGERARAFSFVGLIIGWRIFDYLYDPIFSRALIWLYPHTAYGPFGL